MPKKPKTYQQNFVVGVKHLMAEAELDTLKDTAAYLGFAYMTLYKIMDRSRSPTVEQCITLCGKAGYSANWLLLDRGVMKLETQATIESLAAEMNKLNKKLTKQS